MMSETKKLGVAILGEDMFSSTLHETSGSRANAVANLLIVDNEKSVREGCREIAAACGFNAFSADSAEQAYAILEARSIDAVLLELKLPGGENGLEILQYIRQRRPNTLVVVATGCATVETSVQAMKAGAFDFIAKPFGAQEVKSLLARVVNEIQHDQERRALRERVSSRSVFGMMVGESPEMEKLYRIIAKAAQSTHPVLILGESGTGKELVARSIHFNGPAREKPFIPVDCGSLVPTLIESELFGHTKGAFTGANRAKDGLLTIAEGGTVFLDEIGELPVDLQAKLLRSIQEKEIRPVGSTRAVPMNARVLAATHRDLEAAVAEGKFRRDLYYRLNVLTLRIPPLRERKQDIPLLVQHFLERMAHNTGLQRTVSDEGLKALMEFDWPGNVRELENCIERACTMSSGPELHVGDLPTIMATMRKNAGSGDANAMKILPLAELEKQAILGAIERLNGDKLLAAKKLGIGKTTLYRKLKEYGSHI